MKHTEKKNYLVGYYNTMAECIRLLIWIVSIYHFDVVIIENDGLSCFFIAWWLATLCTRDRKKTIFCHHTFETKACSVIEMKMVFADTGKQFVGERRKCVHQTTVILVVAVGDAYFSNFTILLHPFIVHSSCANVVAIQKLHIRWTNFGFFLISFEQIEICCFQAYIWYGELHQ